MIASVGMRITSCALAFMLLVACSGESANSLVSAAKKSIEQKEQYTAIIQLKNALQKNPKNAEARFLLGKVLLDSGDSFGASIELQKSLDEGFDAEAVTPVLAQAMHSQGLNEKIVSTYGQLNLKTPAANAALRTVVASACLSLSKPREAQGFLDSALEIDNSYIPAQLLQVRMLASENKFALATDLLNKVLVTVPQNSDAWVTKGDVAAQRGDLNEAKLDYREAIARDKANIPAHSAGIWLSLNTKDLASADLQVKAMRAVAPDNPQTKLLSTLIAFEKGDVKAAYEQILQLLKFAPENVKVLHLAGAIELKLGSFIRAETNLLKVLHLDPGQGMARLLLAQVYLRSGDAAKSIKTLQPLTSVSSESWEFNSLLAEALMQNGEMLTAEKYFEQAAKLNPKDLRSRIALAIAQVAKGRIDQGYDELRAISAGDPSATADLALINAQLVRNDFEQALKSLEKLEQKQPRLPLATYLRGLTELQRGGREPARAAFEAALKIDPSYFPAASNLASMDVADGKPLAAAKRFDAVLLADPQNMRASLGLVALQIKAGAKLSDLVAAVSKTVKGHPNELAPRLLLVRLQMELKDLKAANASAQEALTALPENLELLDILGQVQFAKKDLNQALITYNKIIALQPLALSAYLRMAELHIALNDTSSAVQTLRKSLTLKADFFEAQRSLMLIELSQGHAKEALVLAKTVQTQRSGDSIGHMFEGDIYVGQRNWTAAALAYRAGLDKQPSTELTVKLQNVLIMDKKFADAKKLEQQWLKGHPDDSVFLYQLGDLALNSGDLATAQIRYEEVLRLKPENAAALNNLAWVLTRLKKPGALVYSMKANKIAPDNPSYLDTLAEIYQAEGKMDQAIRVQREAVALAPGVHLNRLHLARLYVQTGEKVMAKNELTLLAALGEKFAEQRQVSELLAKL